MRVLLLSVVAICICVALLGDPRGNANPEPEPVQGSTFVVTFNFASVGARNSILADFCASQGLDVYTDSTRTVIDPAKVQPAVTALFKGQIRNAVIDYRARTAAQAADAAQRITDAATVNP